MFPSVTVCNQNQVEASFLKEMNIYGNATKIRHLFNDFINGHQRNLSTEEKKLSENLKDIFLNISGKGSPNPSFFSKSSQGCDDLFTSIRFRNMNLTSNRLPEQRLLWIPIGPQIFGTDFGVCCIFIPHLQMKPLDSSFSIEKQYHGLKANALNGDTMEILLDAEQFNYGYYQTDSAGFKISLHNHLDKPMFQFSSQFVSTGTKTQVNLKPTLSYTTDSAISRFTPDERGCYAEGEANLTYLPYQLGFRYAMNNCLMNQGKEISINGSLTSH